MVGIQSVFAANVRKYRKMEHLSQEQLAEIAGLHRTYIGGIEQRRINVSLKNIGKIATALGVDPALLFLAEEPTKSEDVASRKQQKRRLSAARAGSVQQGGESRAQNEPDFALVTWHNGEMSIRPIEVKYEDLTVQTLCFLILQGHSGDNLVNQYAKVHKELIMFLSEETDEA